jgi:hypothetical protein
MGKLIVLELREDKCGNETDATSEGYICSKTKQQP